MPIVDVDVDCMSIVVFKWMVDCRLLRVDCCMMLLVTSVAVPGGPLHPRLPAAPWLHQRSLLEQASDRERDRERESERQKREEIRRSE